MRFWSRKFFTEEELDHLQLSKFHNFRITRITQLEEANVVDLHKRASVGHKAVDAHQRYSNIKRGVVQEGYRAAMRLAEKSNAIYFPNFNKVVPKKNKLDKTVVKEF